VLEVNVAPMSANTERFLEGAKAFTSGEDDAVVEFIDEEIEFEPLRAATEGTFRGHDGVREFLKDTRESFDRFELDYRDVRELDEERVIALGVIRIRGRGSGVETEVPTAVIATIRDGRMTRFKDYGEHSAALAAAGLD
jgi:ketosteroid isomerase-like protein